MAKGQQRSLLPPEEEERLRGYVQNGSPALQQRAKVILAWHEGVPAREAANRAKLNENQVRYLWQLYRRKGLDLFMVDTEAPPDVAESAAAQPEPAQIGVPAEPPAPVGVSIEALCDEYKVDMAHARHVAALSLKLFDSTMTTHRLSIMDRTLLEAAALVHNIAYVIDQPNHHTRGRDILLATPIRGFSDEERTVLATTTAFHRKKVRPEDEPAYQQLPHERRYDALALSALLRVGDALDNSQSQTTQIVGVQSAPDEVVVLVDGPHAQSDAEQAGKKADLWNQTFPVPIRVIRAVELPFSIRPMPGLDGTMSVTRAGREFALHTLERVELLLKHVQGGDLALLPTLVREAHRLSEAAMLADARDFRKELRWLTDSLEVARINTELAERADLFTDESADSAVGDVLTTKVSEWRGAARQTLVAIDAKRMAKLGTDLRVALTEDIDPNEKALLAFNAGSLLWQQLTALRSVMEFGTSVDEGVEATRRLVDLLSAFRNLLGREVAQVIDMLSPLETHLGMIKTTQSVLEQLEPKVIKKGRKTIVIPLEPELESFRAAQINLINVLADELPGLWDSINTPIFRRAFALTVAVP